MACRCRRDAAAHIYAIDGIGKLAGTPEELANAIDALLTETVAMKQGRTQTYR